MYFDSVFRNVIFGDAHSEYLSGFQKRKKERKKSLIDKRVLEEKEKKKELRKQVLVLLALKYTYA